LFDHSGFIGDILGIVISLLQVFMYVIFARVIISWFSPDPYNPIVQLLRGVTDPALGAFRRFMPRLLSSTGWDFTPLFLILLLQIVISLLSHIHV